MLITKCYTDNGEMQFPSYQHYKLTFSTVNTFNFIPSYMPEGFYFIIR